MLSSRRCGGCGITAGYSRAAGGDMHDSDRMRFGYMPTVNNVRALVTGATGYVGSRLVIALFEPGARGCRDHVVTPPQTHRLRAGMTTSGRLIGRHAPAKEGVRRGRPHRCRLLPGARHRPAGLPGRRQSCRRQRRDRGKGSRHRRIVYLGGFVPDEDELSEHLTSRAEVAGASASMVVPRWCGWVLQ